jgi:aminoglycoside phosphotransferase (APT) family kinase protein
MLEQSDIAHYLLSLGLVKSRDVVEEDLTIRDVSRRNCVFLATTRTGPAFVVKEGTAPTLAHEAAVLRDLAGVLACRIPSVVRFEPETGRLVLSTPPGARDWGDRRAPRALPRIPARILGRTLAAVHRLSPDSVEPQPAGTDLMWGLSLPAPPYALLLDRSAGAQELIADIQAREVLCRRLEEIRDATAEIALVHGDLRWENCLAFPPAGSPRRTRLLLVDWEFAGPGAPAYDVGTVLAECVRAWVESIPILDSRNPMRFAGRAARPMDRLRPAMRAFWTGYATAGPRPPALRRVAELTGVRLLQCAVERAQFLMRPSAHAATLVQVAENLVRRPDAAAAFLGLRE